MSRKQVSRGDGGGGIRHETGRARLINGGGTGGGGVWCTRYVRRGGTVQKKRN